MANTMYGCFFLMRCVGDYHWNQYRAQLLHDLITEVK